MLIPRAGAAIAAVAFPLLAAAAQPPGGAEEAEAIRLLDAGDPEAAVEAAWRAIAITDEFSPEAWSAEVPEGRIVLDEFTSAAVLAYRARRAGYRETLGAALAAAGDPRGAERELRRAVALAPGARIFLRLADLPGIPLPDRVERLLSAWSANPAEPDRILDELRVSGAFRTEAGLAAALDRARFRALDGRRGGLPDAVERLEGVFPASASIAVEGGVWSAERSFAEGRRLLLYLPTPGCSRCGEMISELDASLRGASVDLLAAASDADLPVLMQIAGLTGAGLFRPEPGTAGGRSGLVGRPIGHVVRRAVVPFPPGGAAPWPDDSEQLVFAARAGLSVWRIRLEEGSSRRSLRALFRFLDESPTPDSPAPLTEIPDDPAALYETVRGLEAGAEPLDDLDARLLPLVRRALRAARDPEALAARLLPLAAGLATGNAARVRLLAALVPGFGDAALAAAQELDGDVVRALPTGRTRVAVAEGRIGFQREYERNDGSQVVLSALAGPGLRALAVAPGRAGGVEAGENGFLFRRGSAAADPPCVGWPSPARGFEEVCPATVRGGAAVVRVSQLVGEDASDPPGEGSWIWRRVDGGPEPEEAEALYAGLEAFAGGDLDAAREAFTRADAGLGAGSPVDRAAVRYNLARVAEAGDRREDALAALLAIADAPFPARIAGAVRRLYQRQP